jgi:hypothetical protein
MWKKLLQARIWRRIYLERLGEPLLYNLASLIVLIFGTFSKKIDYDLVPRQPYAFGLKTAFAEAKSIGVKKVVIIEFGVASGAGLFNLALIAKKLSIELDIDYEIIGFDSGKGMPKPLDYRDHPEKYGYGDFPPLGLCPEGLPEKTRLIIGDIASSVPLYEKELDLHSRIAFVSIDVDYYSSTKDCLSIFTGPESIYLPRVVIYLDDVNNIDHNQYCGELLAVSEFNSKDSSRKICKMTQLRNWRIFKNALWLDQMYFLHILDSDYRRPEFQSRREIVKLFNPYDSNISDMLEDNKHLN